MKKISRILAVLLTVFSMFGTIVGCGNIKTTLSAPENVRVVNGYIKWNTVDGALSYLVYIDEDEYFTSENKFYINNAEDLVKGKTYEIRVKAKGDGVLSSSSNYSRSVSYTHLTDNDNVDEGTVVENEGIANQLLSSYITKSVNVLSAKNALEVKGDTSVFKDDAFTKDNLIERAKGELSVTSESKDSVTEMLSKINKSASIKWGLSADVLGIFTSGFSYNFGIDNTTSSYDTTHQYFNLINHSYVEKEYEINNYGVINDIESKFTDNFKEKLKELKNGQITPQLFLEKFGTHLIMGVSYGAKAEIYFSQFSASSIESNIITSKLGVAFNVGVSTPVAGGSLTYEKAQELDELTENKSSNGKTSLFVKTIGGNADIGGQLSSFTQIEQSYSNWVDSSRNKQYHQVIDAPFDDLLPIWECLPDEYDEVSSLLKETFIAKAQEKVASLLLLIEGEETPEYNLDFELQNRKTDNAYKDSSTNEDALNWHIDENGNEFKMVELNILGCKEENGKYDLVNKKKFSFKLKTLQSYTALPLPQPNGEIAPLVTSRSITDDDDTRADSTNIVNARIGYGAYSVTITDKQNNTYKNYKTNIFKDGQKNDYIDLIKVVNGEVKIFGANNENCSMPKTQEVKTIDIVVIYEIGTDIKTVSLFNNISLLTYYTNNLKYTSWRNHITVNFA